MAKPIERKVTASSLGAAAAGAVLALLQTVIYKGHAPPAAVVTIVDLGAPAAAAWIAGYLARHTPRPGVSPPPTPSVTPPPHP